MFEETIGLIGGGYYEIEGLTEAYSDAAEMCLAPYRLGLTATLERADGRRALFDELIGP